MTPAQQELARHALGLPNSVRRSYRNRYYAATGGRVHDEWRAMVAAGEAEIGEAGRTASTLFWLTLTGAKAALEAGERLCPEDFPEAQS